MSHYCCEVWTPEHPGLRVGSAKPLRQHSEREAILEALAPVMMPYSEHTPNTESRRRKFFDYYVLGGRYMGNHDGYKPWENPQNIEMCDMCDGTGHRKDALAQTQNMEWVRGCNGCCGSGVKVMFESKWRYHPQDVMRLRDIKNTLLCYTLIIVKNPERPQIIHREAWNGKDWVAHKVFDGSDVLAFLATKGIKDGWLTTLDYHN